MKYSLYIGVMLLALCFGGCADEAMVGNQKGEGTLLNMYVSIGANTRLAELGSDFINHINTETDGKKHIGLYIYYEDDYNAGDLSKPYIRNLECKITDNKITPTDPTQQIYIYDRMTIVAFYPYNSTAIDFSVKDDEKAYPISESDYSQQTYIPYRAQTNVNPTNAYMIELHFKPQQTCKVEVVLVADRQEDFPQSLNLTDGTIKLLPSVDRYEGGYDGTDPSKGDLRENWVDGITDFPESGTPTGGKFVRRYTAYVWKSGAGDKHHDTNHKHNDNILEKGEILFESDKLTLVVPATVNLSEETVYRYGYNMNTGEIFIPTSDRLIYDAKSLQKAKFDEYRAYQVCDIDLSSISDWNPLTTYDGIYDGGGHTIRGLSYTATPTTNVASEPDKQMYGLFGSITGTSTLMNVHLMEPSITVDYSNAALKDTCYVGAICGLVNPELSDERKREIIWDGLPKELSATVKEALVQELLKDWGTTTCTLRGCKVSNPQITVKGENVRVGALCGGAGNQKQEAVIKDSYAQGGSIAVNSTSDEEKMKYKQVYVAGFCGMLANGEIKQSYSTMEAVSGYVGTTAADGGTTATDLATGFCHLAPVGERITGKVPAVTSCYSLKEDATGGATLFANGWPADWPLFKDDVKATNHAAFPGLWPAYQWEDSWKNMGTSPTIYPILIWEEQFIVENK